MHGLPSKTSGFPMVSMCFHFKRGLPQMKTSPFGISDFPGGNPVIHPGFEDVAEIWKPKAGYECFSYCYNPMQPDSKLILTRSISLQFQPIRSKHVVNCRPPPPPPPIRHSVPSCNSSGLHVPTHNLDRRASGKPKTERRGVVVAP